MFIIFFNISTTFAYNSTHVKFDSQTGDWREKLTIKHLKSSLTKEVSQIMFCSIRAIVARFSLDLIHEHLLNIYLYINRWLSRYVIQSHGVLIILESISQFLGKSMV